MSQRSELEDKHTVVCYGCASEWIDPSKKPNQKYAIRCINCGRSNVWNQKYARKLKKAMARKPSNFSAGE